MWGSSEQKYKEARNHRSAERGGGVRFNCCIPVGAVVVERYTVKRVRTVRRRSPEAVVLSWLRSNGFAADKSSYYNAFAKVSIDLFSFSDIVAVGHGAVWFVQVTSKSNRSARRNKISDKRFPVVTDTWSLQEKTVAEMFCGCSRVVVAGVDGSLIVWDELKKGGEWEMNTGAPGS